MFNFMTNVYSFDYVLKKDINYITLTMRYINLIILNSYLKRS